MIMKVLCCCGYDYFGSRDYWLKKIACGRWNTRLSYKIGQFEFVSDIFVGVEVKMFVDEVGLLMNIKTVSCTVRGLFYVIYVLWVKEEL